jgi:hypothetical protein
VAGETENARIRGIRREHGLHTHPANAGGLVLWLLFALEELAKLGRPDLECGLEPRGGQPSPASFLYASKSR